MPDPMFHLRPSRLPPHVRGFEYVRELVRRNSAIVLDESKDYLIEARLAPLASEQNMGSVDELICNLRRQNPGKLHSRVVEALTTNETHFFRDIHPYRLLSQKVLPELVKSNESSKKLRIWSAACSTGQEPYSIAMCLKDSPVNLDGYHVSILGSDINEEVVSIAKMGLYRQLDVNRGLPASALVRHFERQGQMWRVKDHVRKLCTFEKINLVMQWPKLENFDVIFLRNVLIYFDLESRRAVLEKVAQVLKPGGHLYLGAAETTFNLSDKFVRVQDGPGGSYQRIGGK